MLLTLPPLRATKHTVGCSRIWFYSFPSTVERSAANTGTPMRVGQGLYESHIAKLPRADSTLQVKWTDWRCTFDISQQKGHPFWPRRGSLDEDTGGTDQSGRLSSNTRVNQSLLFRTSLVVVVAQFYDPLSKRFVACVASWCRILSRLWVVSHFELVSVQASWCIKLVWHSVLIHSCKKQTSELIAEKPLIGWSCASRLRSHAW